MSRLDRAKHILALIRRAFRNVQTWGLHRCDSTGAAIDAISGVFSGSVLHFHEAATRALLRSFDLGAPVAAVRQIGGDLQGLLAAAGGRLLLVDGRTGVIRHATGYLGNELGKRNRIATADLGGGYTRVGVGSDGGVIRFRLYTGDGIFDYGFESID